MFNWIRAARTRRPAPSRSTHSRTRSRLALEPLEDRTTPTVSSITSNFNGTAIPAGDYLWFSSVAKVSGLGNTPAARSTSPSQNDLLHGQWDPVLTGRSGQHDHALTRRTPRPPRTSPAAGKSRAPAVSAATSSSRGCRISSPVGCLGGSRTLSGRGTSPRIQQGSRSTGSGQPLPTAVQFGFERAWGQGVGPPPMFTTIRTMLARPKTTGSLLSAARRGRRLELHGSLSATESVVPTVSLHPRKLSPGMCTSTPTRMA